MTPEVDEEARAQVATLVGALLWYESKAKNYLYVDGGDVARAALKAAGVEP